MNQERQPPAWRSLAPALLLLAGLLWLLRDTAAAMVSIWLRSDTFTHAFLVLPITLWLVWRKRAILVALPTRAEPVWLLPMAACCIAWLLGELASVGAASQFAFVTLVVLSVPALFGRAVANALLFPLCFLYFAVPFGEFTVPTMMEWTADFTVAALRLSGVPVYRDGLQFVIPSGTWSVVEACSGVRYLIASFMVGSLFAYLNFTSTRRRVVFALASLAVPVVANWARAYMIVMIGHLSGNELAVGVDHLLYGWVFFGVVIGLMFFIGARWAQPESPAVPTLPAPAIVSDHQRWLVVVAIAGMILGTQYWLWRLDHSQPGGPPSLVLPAGVEGFGAARQEPALPWAPGFRDASVSKAAAYGASTTQVWLWVGYFRQQGPTRKLVSSTNAVVSPEDGAWSQTERGRRAEGDGLPELRSSTIRRGHALSGDTQRLRVWHLYWIGGRWIENDIVAKMWHTVDRLLGRGDDGAVVMFVAPWDDDADAVLEKFSRAALPALAIELDRVRDTR